MLGCPSLGDKLDCWRDAGPSIISTLRLEYNNLSAILALLNYPPGLSLDSPEIQNVQSGPALNDPQMTESVDFLTRQLLALSP